MEDGCVFCMERFLQAHGTGYDCMVFLLFFQEKAKKQRIVLFFLFAGIQNGKRSAADAPPAVEGSGAQPLRNAEQSEAGDDGRDAEILRPAQLLLQEGTAE